MSFFPLLLFPSPALLQQASANCRRWLVHAKPTYQVTFTTPPAKCVKASSMVVAEATEIASIPSSSARMHAKVSAKTPTVLPALCNTVKAFLFMHSLKGSWAQARIIAVSVSIEHSDRLNEGELIDRLAKYSFKTLYQSFSLESAESRFVLSATLHSMARFHHLGVPNLV